MALVKCPRCELNYMNDTDEMCSVCRREVRGESEQYDMIELCSSCLKEAQRRNATESTDDSIVHEENPIGIDSVSGMDEIDLGGDMGDMPFDDEDADFAEDLDDEDMEDDEE